MPLDETRDEANTAEANGVPADGTAEARQAKVRRLIEDRENLENQKAFLDDDEQGANSAGQRDRTNGSLGENGSDSSTAPKEIDLKLIERLSAEDVKEKAEAYIAANKAARDNPDLEKAQELVDKTREDFKNAATADAKAFPEAGKDHEEVARERMEDAFAKAAESDKTRDENVVATLRENVSKEDFDALKDEATERREELREEAKQLIAEKNGDAIDGKDTDRQNDIDPAEMREEKERLQNAVDEKLDKAAKLSDDFDMDVKEQDDRSVEAKEGKEAEVETPEERAKREADEILLEKLADAKERRSEVAEKYGSIQGIAESVPGEARNAKLDEEKYMRAAENISSDLEVDDRQRVNEAIDEETTKRVSKQAVADILNPDHEDPDEHRGVSPQEKVAELAGEIRATGRTADRAARTDETSITEDMDPEEKRSFLQEAKDWASQQYEAAGKQLQSAREYAERSFGQEQSQTVEQLKLDERSTESRGLA